MVDFDRYEYVLALHLHHRKRGASVVRSCRVMVTVDGLLAGYRLIPLMQSREAIANSIIVDIASFGVF
jgi:hypothetical protein